MTIETTFSALVVWLATPISGATAHAISAPTAWHGRLMVTAWAVFAPLAILVARYFKVTPGQDWPRVVGNSFWFLWHRGLGYLIMATTIAAVGLIALAYGPIGPINGLHAAFGWITTALVIAIVAGTLARGTHGGPVHPMTKQPMPPDKWFGDHFNMTPRRIVFEYTHKFGGAALLVISIAATYSGLARADAPRWMFVTLSLWWLCVAVAALVLQRQGRGLDTYQAIWGPSPDLPGSNRTPIGFGIRRVHPLAASEQKSEPGDR